MSQAPSMPVFVDALLGDTMHLTADEFGAYCLILFATWRHGGQALPDDDRILSRICRVSPTRWRRVLRPRLIAFFDITDGHFHQKRLEKEWKFLSNLRDKNSAAGKASALKRKERQATTVPTGLQPNGNPYTYKRKKDSDADASGADAPAAAPDPTKQLWDRGLAILGVKQRPLLGKMVSQHGKPAVLGAIVETEREQPVDPVAYFIECCERRRRSNGRGDQEHAYQVLARAAVEHDERQSRRSAAEAAD